MHGPGHQLVKLGRLSAFVDPNDVICIFIKIENSGSKHSVYMILKDFDNYLPLGVNITKEDCFAIMRMIHFNKMVNIAPNILLNMDLISYLFPINNLMQIYTKTGKKFNLDILELEGDKCYNFLEDKLTKKKTA